MNKPAIRREPLPDGRGSDWSYGASDWSGVNRSRDRQGAVASAGAGSWFRHRDLRGRASGGAFLAEGANPFTEVVSCKYLIPHVAGDGAGLLPTEPFDTLHEGHALLGGCGTESGHHAGDFEGPDWRAVAHFVDQAKFARFGGKTDPPGEGKLQRAPLSQGTGDGSVNQEGPEPEADFGEAETGVRT